MTARKIPYGHGACVYVVLALFVFGSILREDIISHALSYPPISFPTCTVMHFFLYKFFCSKLAYPIQLI